MKKALLAAIVLLISAFALFALEGEVTWVWFENDPNVEYYRYQLDGEEDDKWTVVDWSVTEVTYMLDVSVLHVLYLQQSYDGINWSESSYTESDIYIESEEPEEDFFDDDFFDDEFPAEPDEEVDEIVPEEEEDEVIEATVIEEEIYLPEVEVETYDPLSFLDVGLGFMNSVPDSAGPKTWGLNVSYSRTFVKAGIFDIGLKADLGVYTSKDLFSFRKWSDGQWLENWQLQSYLNCMALVTTKVGNCDLYGAAGPDFSYTIGKNKLNNSGITGLALELGVRYHRFEKVAIGFAVTDHQYLFSLFENTGVDMANRMELKAFLSWSL